MLIKYFWILIVRWCHSQLAIYNKHKCHNISGTNSVLKAPGVRRRLAASKQCSGLITHITPVIRAAIASCD